MSTNPSRRLYTPIQGTERKRTESPRPVYTSDRSPASRCCFTAEPSAKPNASDCGQARRRRAECPRAHPSRASSAWRHCSVCWTWLNVKRCRPATPAAGRGEGGRRARSSSRSGLVAAGRAQPQEPLACARPGTGRTRRRRPWPPSAAAWPAPPARPAPRSSGSVTPAGPDPGDPLAQRGRVEAQVADDVGGVPPLVPHGLDGDVVVDPRVALRVAGDPDRARTGCPSRPAVRAATARCRTRPAGGSASPAGHEHVVHPAGGQPGHDVGQVRVVAHQPGGQVRHHPVARPGQPLGQVERGVQALGRARRSRSPSCSRGHPLAHRVLDAAGREHLVPRRAASSGAELASPADQADRRRLRAITARRPPARPPDGSDGLRPDRRSVHATGPVIDEPASSRSSGRADSITVSGRPNRAATCSASAASPGRAVLGQPDHPPVVAEVVGPQLRVAVQAEPGRARSPEAADQEVGQQVGARLGRRAAPRIRSGPASTS